MKFKYGTLEEEILRLQNNAIIAKYLNDTCQHIVWNPTNHKKCFIRYTVQQKAFVKNGGVVKDPIPLNPVQILIPED